MDIAVSTPSGRAVLVVSNTGAAIAAPDIDRLFQPFQRLAPNRSGHRDGNGLGLSIVKAIADAHDATITATSQPHGGLRIEVSFPTPDDSSDRKTRQRHTGRPAPGTTSLPATLPPDHHNMKRSRYQVPG